MGMNTKFFIKPALLLSALIFTSFTHPLKLTTSLIEYNDSDEQFLVECRVFIDDFSNTINRKDLDVSNLSKADIEEIEYYFCGPPLMNASVIKTLDELGVPEENIAFDDFGG